MKNFNSIFKAFEIFTKNIVEKLDSNCNICDSRNSCYAHWSEAHCPKFKFTPRCNKCVYLPQSCGDNDIYGQCKTYKRDPPDGGYYG